MKVRRDAAHSGLGPRVRVRPWAFDRGVVQLALADQAIVPTRDEVRGWVEALTCAEDVVPVHTIRTGALFPDAAARFSDAGFAVIDTLALLRIDLAARAPRRRPPGAATVPLRARRHRDASLIDRAAFGDPWGNEARDLGEIRHATPVHRARACTAPGGRRRPLVAFAISGAASGQGYLQRLAVAPGHQGQGHGRALAIDALVWMRSRRLTHGLVNTAVTNRPALGLYESLGFERVPEQLVVMQLEVSPAR